MAPAFALLVGGVAIGLGVPAQTIAPPGSAADAAFYLKRGEEFSSVHEYDRAIGDYTTATAAAGERHGCCAKVQLGPARTELLIRCSQLARRPPALAKLSCELRRDLAEALAEAGSRRRRWG